MTRSDRTTVLLRGEDIVPIPGTAKLQHLEENVKAAVDFVIPGAAFSDC